MQAVQRGWVGINVYTFALSPLTNSTADVEATQRASDFMMGWWVPHKIAQLCHPSPCSVASLVDLQMFVEFPVRASLVNT